MRERPRARLRLAAAGSRTGARRRRAAAAATRRRAAAHLGATSGRTPRSTASTSPARSPWPPTWWRRSCSAARRRAGGGGAGPVAAAGRRAGASLGDWLPPPERCAAGAPRAEDGGRDAAAAFERLGLPFDAARCRLAAGRAAARGGRRWGAAREQLEAAAAGVRRARLAGLGGAGARGAGRRRRRAGRAPRASSRPPSAAWRSWPPPGRSTKEIALSARRERPDRRGALRRIYAKLGVRSRAQLALKIGGSGD